ncbi:MAG: bifunctional 2-methylcitrate dehydratase/aconitate hydratase [Coxiellaceae bacterium]|nr:bifunctional 2-methylcitrate dehydratase/aconitate hydratase [Coxiellaceae bacterium]
MADYVCDATIDSDVAYYTAYWCLLDSLACMCLAARFPDCQRMLGATVPGEITDSGVRVPGTAYQLNTVEGAFNIGTLIRWLDFNDTWLAAEWGHPSDNFGGILAVADYQSRHQKNITMRDVLTAAIKAYEIQGVMALENSFNSIGLDHVILVKLASTAVTTRLFGGNRDQVMNAISHAFLDGHPLRTYRHAPNTGSRKSWAAGDATSRGVWLAQTAMRGAMGYPSVLTAPTWGFYDVYFDGKPFSIARDYGSYVMENILFKIAFPAEFHGQTAVECAIQLHPLVVDRLDDIQRISVRTQQSAMRIINKVGELHNPADRDHSLQYMIAVGLIWGELKADHYEDKFAADVRIDKLRDKMDVSEAQEFSVDYLDPAKRAIANAIQIHFNDGSSTEEIRIDYPLGHRKRRDEAIPVLQKKFRDSIMTHFAPAQYEAIFEAVEDPSVLDGMAVREFMDLWVK